MATHPLGTGMLAPVKLPPPQKQVRAFLHVSGVDNCTLGVAAVS